MQVSTNVFSALRGIGKFEPLLVEIRGECMYPTLGAGSVVEVVRKKIYFPGDIVVGQRLDGLLFSHRLLVIYRKGGVWKALTKADRQSVYDAAVPIDSILGRVRTDTKTPLSVRCRSLITGIDIIARRFWRAE